MHIWVDDTFIYIDVQDLVGRCVGLAQTIKAFLRREIINNRLPATNMLASLPRLIFLLVSIECVPLLLNIKFLGDIFQ